MSELWTINHISDYLHISVSSLRNRVINAPGFPQAIRIKTTEGRGSPLWKADEIVEWVEMHQERRVA